MGAFGARVGTGNDFFDFIKPGVCQRVSVSSSSAQSSATASTTSVVEIFSTEDCWIKFGSSPTAVANDGSSVFMPGGIIKYYVITAGDKIAAIRDSVDGYLHIVEAAANA